MNSHFKTVALFMAEKRCGLVFHLSSLDARWAVVSIVNSDTRI